MTETDLVIIGAGIAGLSAARAAARRGLKVMVLEAGGRIGGRAYTESVSLGVPFDHGCQFLHAASRNPLRQIADRAGFAYKEGGHRQRIHADGRWLSAAEAAAFFDGVQRRFAHLARRDPGKRDVSAAQALPPSDRRAKLFDLYYEEFLGAPPGEVGALEHRSYVDTYEDWPVRDGFGALVAAHYRDVPVHLETTVRRVDYAGSAVVVETDRGPIKTRQVLVTVSTGVLAAEQIGFRPALPAWKLRAIESVPMGYAGKIAFRLEDAPKGLAPVHILASAANGLYGNVHVRPFGRPFIVVIVAGHDWKALELAEPAAMIEAARAMVEEVLGRSIRRHLGRTVTTNWQVDRRFLGGHSYRSPGAADARLRLAAPLRGRLFFAGEATSSEAWATAHGAYESGRRAVAEILAARRGREPR